MSGKAQLTAMEPLQELDFHPDVPMQDDSNVLELYADDIGNLKVHGLNFTTTHFTWAQRQGGLLVRVPVVKVIMPVDSNCDVGTHVRALLEQAGRAVPIVPNSLGSARRQ